MFIVERERLIEGLEKLQRTRCDYDSFGFIDFDQGPPPFCDCKYGYHGEKHKGEQNGCPELRNVVALLKVMSDAEYESMMMERARCTL